MGTRVAAIEGLDPATYRRHSLHADDRVWVEKNCYIDIWIEVVHALGLDPVAMLGIVVALDFEGDQWTFFKPSHDEIRALYGLDVQELNAWRPLIEHAVEHVGAGKLISTEADAWWLPDTSGTDYRLQHTKTTIVLTEIDVDARRLGYFHNAGYYVLEGEDFAETFRLDRPPDPAFLPLFAELVRKDRLVVRSHAELGRLAAAFLRTHYARRPARNPVLAFQERFAADLATLQERGLPYYHAWAFGTIRQLGAATELAAAHLRWLPEGAEATREAGAVAFEQISKLCKTLILKAARAVNARRPLDAVPILGEMAMSWDRGMASIADLVGA